MFNEKWHEKLSFQNQLEQNFSPLLFFLLNFIIFSWEFNRCLGERLLQNFSHLISLNHEEKYSTLHIISIQPVKQL